jgi:hypothetical protein
LANFGVIFGPLRDPSRAGPDRYLLGLEDRTRDMQIGPLRDLLGRGPKLAILGSLLDHPLSTKGVQNVHPVLIYVLVNLALF